jgi:hypothetical protein
MSELPNLPAVRTVAIAMSASFIVVAATTASWCQAACPPAAPKTIIIQVTPAPEPVAPTVAQPILPPASAVAEEPVAPPPRENPGLINEIGKMLSAPTWSLPALPALPSLKMPSDTNEALPKLNTMVKGRMVCPIAANGAPDCKAGSDRLCQAKGFKEGKSLDTDSAQSCSPRSLMTCNRADDVCKTEHYVTRALCQ